MLGTVNHNNDKSHDLASPFAKFRENTVGTASAPLVLNGKQRFLSFFMLTHHRKPVSLSLISTDLLLGSTLETSATLLQKDRERFHLLLSEPALPEWEPELDKMETNGSRRHLWLEISPYRMTLTMQGEGKLGYRHHWERGIYGINRYWLRRDLKRGHESFCLRNYTRNLILEGYPLPESLCLDYELWSGNLQLGRYVLSLEIHH